MYSLPQEAHNQFRKVFWGEKPTASLFSLGAFRWTLAMALNGWPAALAGALCSLGFLLQPGAWLGLHCLSHDQQELESQVLLFWVPKFAPQDSFITLARTNFCCKGKCF